MTDDYPTCEETYVTLRVYHDSADPASVSSALQLEPSDSQRVGESYERRGLTRSYKLTGWFLCSKGHVESYDTAKHLDWLLHRLQPCQQALDTLRFQGWRMDIGSKSEVASEVGGRRPRKWIEANRSARRPASETEFRRSVRYQSPTLVTRDHQLQYT